MSREAAVLELAFIHLEIIDVSVEGWALALLKSVE